MRRRYRERKPEEFGLDPAFPLLHDIEAPRGDEPAWGHSVPVRGWILVPPDARLEGPWIEHAGRVALRTQPRPDVEGVFGGPRSLGFDQLVEVDVADPAAPWELVVVVDGERYHTPVPVPLSDVTYAAMQEAKRAKLARIEPLLRCPALRTGSACHGTLSRYGSTLSCARCGATYGATDRGFDFLSPELRSLASVVDTDNVSLLGYDDSVKELVDDLRDGLVLDDGSGLKDWYLGHVVYFEIVDYPTTDVLGVGESLPFGDDSFDAVISIAVLEHVRDPFRCAAEIVRVLKPGGRVYAAVPFLQPYHGYPSHYYNMTLQGLENLFADGCTIEQSGTPRYGLPILTLSWFLGRYVEGLPPAVAEEFRQKRVADLLGDGYRFLDDEFVRALDTDANHDLASVNYLIATKRG